LGADFRRRFDEAHRALFHSADASLPLEVVGLRISGASGASSGSRSPRRINVRRKSKTPRALESLPVVFRGKSRATQIHAREPLAPGMRIRGPAIVVEYSSTTVVAPEWTATVDSDHNLLVTPD